MGRGNLSLKEINGLLFFAVFSNDGAALSKLQSQDQHGSIIVTIVCLVVMILSWAILNFMISISGNTYTTYEQKANSLFLKHRCMAVEEFVLRCSWSRCLHRTDPKRSNIICRYAPWVLVV